MFFLLISLAQNINILRYLASPAFVEISYIPSLEIISKKEVGVRTAGDGRGNERVRAADAKFMATFPNQSAPSAEFSPAKVTHTHTYTHCTAHYWPRFCRQPRERRRRTTSSSDKYVNDRREEKRL